MLIRKLFPCVILSSLDPHLDNKMHARINFIKIVSNKCFTLENFF